MWWLYTVVALCHSIYILYRFSSHMHTVCKHVFTEFTDASMSQTMLA